MSTSGWDRIEQLRRKTGHLDAMFGTRVLRVEGGSGDGIQMVTAWNADGLRLSVMVGRGMDLFEVEHRGRPLHWQGPPRMRSRFAHEPHGWGWLRNFHGGLLVTCGLDHILFPYEREVPEYHFPAYQKRGFGLHGRISNEGGELIERSLVDVDGEPVVRIRGRVVQATLFHERLELVRTIDVPVFAPIIRISDRVTNTGYDHTHHELLYHINLGYPLVDEGTVVTVPTGDRVRLVVAPTAPGLQERVTAHDIVGDRATVTVESPVAGMGIALAYEPRVLPHFFVWSMPADGVNAIGLEPSTTRRSSARADEELDFLAPGASVEYHLEFVMLDLLAGA